MSRLHLERRGSGGVPIVLLHGVTIDHRMMLPLDPVIAAAGDFTRYYMDLPGHGRSDPVDPMTAQSIAERIAEEIRGYAGSDRFAVIGASFGGRVATLITDMFGSQVLGTALLAPGLVRPGHRTLPDGVDVTADDQLLASLSAQDRAAFAFVTAQQDRTQWDLYAAHVLPGLNTHDQAAGVALAASQRTEPWGLPAPHDGQHLVVTGRQDRVVGWVDQRRLLDQYPHCTYAVLDRCGHNVHLEQPDATSGLLTSWLHALR